MARSRETVSGRAARVMAKEENILARLDAGEESYVLQGLPPPLAFG